MVRMLFVICCFVSLQKKEPVISWNTSYSLSWSDFNATPNYKVSAAAITASGITFGFSVKETETRVISFTTEVYAHFYPKKSWYKPGIADKHVLSHEQLHFDITELFARKFRKEISFLKTSNTIKKDLRNLHKKINKELSIMQDTYDDESNYSRNKELQTKWQLFINQELQKLSKYKLVD